MVDNTQTNPTTLIAGVDNSAGDTAQNKEKIVSISFPTDVYFKSGVRDFVFSVVSNMTKFPEKWAYRFQSVVDELCNNAIEHGSQVGDLIMLKLVIVENDRIEVIVEDGGHGKQKITAKDLYDRIEELRVRSLNPLANISLRGRGLAQIVMNWTDKLEYTDIEGGGLRAHVIKYLKNVKEEVSEPKTGVVFGK